MNKIFRLITAPVNDKGTERLSLFTGEQQLSDTMQGFLSCKATEKSVVAIAPGHFPSSQMQKRA